jgi:hypothetical protein
MVVMEDALRALAPNIRIDRSKKEVLRVGKKDKKKLLNPLEISVLVFHVGQPSS